MEDKLSKITRFEIIDHTPCTNCDGSGHVLTPTDSAAGQSIAFNKECDKCHGMGTKGREVIFWDAYKQIEASVQDDGKTLKIFISRREDNVS